MNIEKKILLDSDENVILDARKHWFVIFIELFWIIAVALLAPIIFIALSIFTPYYALYLQVYTAEIQFFYLLALLFCWIIGFSIITDYYLDILRITNKRIIDIDQKGFFSRNIASMRLEDVQDVTIETAGLLFTLLKIGTIRIQSAGELNEFIIKGVRHPEHVKLTILDHQGKKEEAPKKVTVLS